MPPESAQHGRMHASITAAAAVVCLSAVSVSVSGCGQPSFACRAEDYVGGGTSGYPTPQQALQSVLTRHEQWLAATGWKVTERDAHTVAFASGNDSIDVVQNKAGKWNVGGVTACQ